MAQSTFYDLFSPQSADNLKQHLSKSDIVVNPNRLYEKKQTKESLLAQIASDLQISPKIVELKSNSIAMNGLEELKRQNKKENFQKMKICFLINSFLIQSLIEEAMMLFSHKEKIKELQLEIKAYIAKLADANFERLAIEYEIEKMQKMEVQTRAIMLADMEKTHAETMKQLTLNFAKIDQLDLNIEASKSKKQEIIAQQVKALCEVMNDFTLPDGKKPFANMPKDLQEAFWKEYRKEVYKIDSKLEKLEYKIHKEELKNERDLNTMMTLLAKRNFLIEDSDFQEIQKTNGKSGLFFDKRAQIEEGLQNYNTLKSYALKKFIEAHPEIKALDDEINKLDLKRAYRLRKIEEAKQTKALVDKILIDKIKAEKFLECAKKHQFYDIHDSGIDVGIAIVEKMKNCEQISHQELEAEHILKRSHKEAKKQQIKQNKLLCEKLKSSHEVCSYVAESKLSNAQDPIQQRYQEDIRRLEEKIAKHKEASKKKTHPIISFK